MKKYRTLSTVAFCIYIILIVWLVVFQFDFGMEEPILSRTRSFNFIPFAHTYSAVQVIDKIVLFIPFGLFLRMKNREHFLTSTLIIIGSSIALQILQYALALHMSICDITDVILNTAGGLSGFGITSLIFHVFKNEEKTEKILTIVSSLAIFCIFAALCFLFLCMLLARI